MKNGLMIPGGRRHGRQGQDRGEAVEKQERVGHRQQVKMAFRARVFSQLTRGTGDFFQPNQR